MHNLTCTSAKCRHLMVCELINLIECTYTPRIPTNLVGMISPYMERVEPRQQITLSVGLAINRIRSEMAKTGQTERIADNIANNGPFLTAIGKSSRNWSIDS